MLHLEKVNGNNVWDILKLTVSKSHKNFIATNEIVTRHIVGGTNRTLISANLPSRSCRTGTCRRLSAA